MAQLTKSQLRKDIQAIVWGFWRPASDDSPFIGCDSEGVYDASDYATLIEHIDRYCGCLASNEDDHFLGVGDLSEMGTINEIVDWLWIRLEPLGFERPT